MNPELKLFRHNKYYSVKECSSCKHIDHDRREIRHNCCPECGGNVETVIAKAVHKIEEKIFNEGVFTGCYKDITKDWNKSSTWLTTVDYRSSITWKKLEKGKK